MGKLMINTSDGKKIEIPVLGLDEHTKYYPRAWCTSNSPFNYPQENAPIAAAGSFVNYPFKEKDLSEGMQFLERVGHISGAQLAGYIEQRTDIKYTVIAKTDIDESRHVGKYYPGNKPHPHWNFEVKREISGRKKLDRYVINHRKDTNVSKCDWIEVSLVVNGFTVAKKKFNWSNPGDQSDK